MIKFPCPTAGFSARTRTEPGKGECGVDGWLELHETYSFNMNWSGFFFSNTQK